MQTDGQANEAKHQLDKFGHTAIARRLIYYDRNFGTKIPVSGVREGWWGKKVGLIKPCARVEIEQVYQRNIGFVESAFSLKKR